MVGGIQTPIATADQVTALQPTPTLAQVTASAAPTVTDEAAPVSQRIQFAPGATAVTVEGELIAGEQHQYLFRALGGQTARIEISSAVGSANFTLAAANGSAPFKGLDDPERTWQGILPETQDYVLTTTAPQKATYRLTLSIDPLPEPDLPVVADPGNPPTDRCIAAHPGGTAVVTIYQGPGTQFAPVARLGNWVEILKSENGWYQVLTGPGQTGWLQGSDVGLVGPCDAIEGPTRVLLPTDGSPWLTVETIALGEVDRFVFLAEAGQRAIISLNTAGSANFSLVGAEDGQPYKRVVNEDRAWESILPAFQDYLLTVVTADDVTDYELLIAVVPAPPFTVIYDAHMATLLGGFRDALWVDADTAAAALLGGEQYGVYHMGHQLGLAIGSAAVAVDGICPGHTINLTPPPDIEFALALAGNTWEAALRLVAPVELSQTERQAITDLLAQQGLALDVSELLVQEALGTDLDGDGLGEIIVQAARLKDGGATPSVDAGDYFITAVLMDVNGRLHAEPLILDVYPQSVELAYPWRYKLSGVLDLNGDGHLEVVLAGLRWEGKRTLAFSIGQSGGAIIVLEAACSL
jgi:hypothetical protein